MKKTGRIAPARLDRKAFQGKPGDHLAILAASSVFKRPAVLLL
jgi:hypothetical protein